MLHFDISQCFLSYMTLIFQFKCTLKCHLQFVSIWASLKFCCLVMGSNEHRLFCHVAVGFCISHGIKCLTLSDVKNNVVFSHDIRTFYYQPGILLLTWQEVFIPFVSEYYLHRPKYDTILFPI